MVLGLHWDSTCPWWGHGEAGLKWKLEGLGWIGEVQVAPTPVASPKIQLRLASATENLGAFIITKVHRHH